MWRREQQEQRMEEAGGVAIDASFDYCVVSDSYKQLQKGTKATTKLQKATQNYNKLQTKYKKL